MDVRGWSLTDWNEALVKAIFLAPSRSGATLSRIDATGRILATLAGTDFIDRAKQSFIASFGQSPAEIRSHFVWSNLIPFKTASDGIPPCFAALYLSLLAASADESTVHEGNFRHRFAALVRCPEVANFSFQDLPDLWKYIAHWSRRRAEEKGDCVRLVLPDPPRHENIIGHSKRLAFPTYRDDYVLRKVLRDEGLGNHSDFRLVAKAVFSHFSDFSESFRQEHQSFHTLVSKGRNREAFDSPFWGAVRDIAWEEEEAICKKGGYFCIHADPSDPQEMGLVLLSDEVGLASVAEEQKERLPRPRAQYTHCWKPVGGLVSIESLVALSLQNDAFGRSSIGRALNAGCLAFFPDELGNFSSDGTYYDRGPVIFLLRGDVSGRLLDLVKCIGLKGPIISPPLRDGWAAATFPSVSQTVMQRLVTELPDNARKFLAIGWMPPRPRIRGGARFGQAVFLNPASNPFVLLEGAVSGRYQLFGEGGQDIATGVLSSNEEGFYIPSGELIGAEGVQACCYSLVGPKGEHLGAINVAVVSEVPTKASEIRPLKSLMDWVADGTNGMLADLESVGNALKQQSAITSSYDIRPLTGGWPLFEASGEPSLVHWEPFGVDSCNDPLPWLAEVLMLRFQRRPTLQFSDLQAHLSMAAEATDIKAWAIKRLLLACGWLRVLNTRTAPHAVVRPASRFISSHMVDGQVIARISGMLSKYERQLLLSELLPGESGSEIRSEEALLSVGCFQLQLASPERPAQLANLLELIPTRMGDIGNPLGGIFQRTSEIECVALPRLDDSFEMWDDRNRVWGGLKSSGIPLSSGTFLRREGAQRITYWVVDENTCWKTDSITWARLLRCMIMSKKLGRMSSNGDVVWSSQLNQLPFWLTHWWLHWGGGCIGLNGESDLVFIGSASNSVWNGIALRPTQDGKKGWGQDIAVKRRLLALRLRQKHSNNIRA
ncbi:hypothetical protein [Chromobacterium haemolyticum]|uniref:hypothetical protein n=1 Tax=Chromobacterium haemolyticum TaxID=394935 RepID=UPI001746AA0D|nr:hypothetical protein [Chromobacterium haemolyticum]QOD82938.1 hypothetical protein IEZ30_00045 [Chromobacterium haemolyticum]